VFCKKGFNLLSYYGIYREAKAGGALRWVS